MEIVVEFEFRWKFHRSLTPDQFCDCRSRLSLARMQRAVPAQHQHSRRLLVFEISNIVNRGIFVEEYE